MKVSRREAHCKAHSIPVVQFEDQTLTSFSGLVVFQELFSRLNLKERVRSCFRHLTHRMVFGLQKVFLR